MIHSYLLLKIVTAINFRNTISDAFMYFPFGQLAPHVRHRKSSRGSVGTTHEKIQSALSARGAKRDFEITPIGQLWPSDGDDDDDDDDDGEMYIL